MLVIKKMNRNEKKVVILKRAHLLSLSACTAPVTGQVYFVTTMMNN